MISHEIRVYPSAETPSKSAQFAWKIAALAADPVPVGTEVAGMVINRIIDNAAVAMAAINRRPVANARSQALAHPRQGGAAVFGLPMAQRFEAEWAGWANATAVRELDFHDTFFGAESAHPGDNISALIAVAQQCDRNGADLIRAIATAYEIQLDLAMSMCLFEHKIDHVAHLGPSITAGIGALLGLDTGTIYQAVQHAVHVSFSTRQTRKGEISSWKAYAPAHLGKIAVDAIDRAMRGESGPSPIYEGEDSVIAAFLGGADRVFRVDLPGPGEPKRAILDTFTKEHSVAYHCQPMVDLAFRMRMMIEDTEAIETVTIHSKRQTHMVTGSGSNDPQKYDPKASRETLDHSIMYAFAVALEDGEWHHERSYSPERSGRPETVRLWRKVKTVEDDEWNRRFADAEPLHKPQGGRVEITFKDREPLVDEIDFADAHPLGARPFARPEYVRKFETLCEGVVEAGEIARFIALVQDLPALASDALGGLNVEVPPGSLDCAKRDHRGIF